MTKKEMKPILEEYAAISAQLKELEAKKAALSDTIKLSMSTAKVDVIEAGKYCAVLTHRAGAVRVDTKALKRDMPDVAARYSYTSEPVVALTVKAVKVSG